eukprot:TRINITY_DN54154_c0_g1_i1.p1 TRINITY_DN54154_c0_g1~~TRINITY_DN54154_c0_g1_i1.p1  ORF type:complete len:342 (-),score=64.37 TRINITY_DN54154_c0_g1_i1:34-1059(-)
MVSCRPAAVLCLLTVVGRGFSEERDDEEEDEWVDGHPPEPRGGGPYMLFATEYKTGTHLADDLAGALQGALKEFYSNCSVVSQDVAGDDAALAAACAEKDLAALRVRSTKTHSWLNLDRRPVDFVRRGGGASLRHRAALFFRDPVEILASSYMYSWNTSECEERAKLYSGNSEDACDLVDPSVMPQSWVTKADGLLELAPFMHEQLRAMNQVLLESQGVSDLLVLWMDEILESHAFLSTDTAKRLYRFALRAAKPSLEDDTLRQVIADRAVQRAVDRVTRSLKTGGAAGKHVHKAQFRQEVVDEIYRLVDSSPHIGGIVNLRKEWWKLRLGSSAPHERVDL